VEADVVAEAVASRAVVAEVDEVAEAVSVVGELPVEAASHRGLQVVGEGAPRAVVADEVAVAASRPVEAHEPVVAHEVVEAASRPVVAHEVAVAASRPVVAECQDQHSSGGEPALRTRVSANKA